MAAARSRQDVARLLRAHDLPASPAVDGTFVAVLAAQARDAAGTSVAAPPRRALKLAGAAVAVVASTVGVAVAANQGLFVPPAGQQTPPVTAPSNTSWPSPVDADDPAEETDDRASEPDASEKSAPREHREDAPDADDLSTEGTQTPTPTHRGPAKPEDETTTGGPGGQDGTGDGPADDDSGDDRTDDGSEDGPDESESPEPDDSESDGAESDGVESDEPETDSGADSSETSDPEPDEATESAGVDDSEETNSD